MVNLDVRRESYACSKVITQERSSQHGSTACNTSLKLSVSSRGRMHPLSRSTDLFVCRFELLIVDVEGYEWEVFRNFNISEWKPQVVIVEIEDEHESFKVVKFLQKR